MEAWEVCPQRRRSGWRLSSMDRCPAFFSVPLSISILVCGQSTPAEAPPNLHRPQSWHLVPGGGVSTSLQRACRQRSLRISPLPESFSLSLSLSPPALVSILSRSRHSTGSENPRLAIDHWHLVTSTCHLPFASFAGCPPSPFPSRRWHPPSRPIPSDRPSRTQHPTSLQPFSPSPTLPTPSRLIPHRSRICLD